jgi:hypothetical protein
MKHVINTYDTPSLFVTFPETNTIGYLGVFRILLELFRSRPLPTEHAGSQIHSEANTISHPYVSSVLSHHGHMRDMRSLPTPSSPCLYSC